MIFRPSDAVPARAFLLVAQYLAVRTTALIVRRHADYFSHGEPVGDSSRSAARTAGTSHERVSDGPRHALIRIGRHGCICLAFRRGTGLGACVGGLDRVDWSDLLASIAGAETGVGLNSRASTPR